MGANCGDLANKRAEIERKLAAKQERIKELNDLARRIDDLIDKLYSPAEYTGAEYNDLHNTYSTLCILYDKKEKEIKALYPYKDIEQMLKEISEGTYTTNNLI